MAKEMQEAIVRVGNGMIEKKEVKTAQSFRYVILENTYLKDTSLFLYPLALVKLALFIMTCHKVRQASCEIDHTFIGEICESKAETLGDLSEKCSQEDNSCSCSYWTKSRL